MNKLLAIGVVALGTLAAVLLPTLSRAEAPGKNGRIAYMVKDTKDHWQIWVANSDLSGAKKLTHGRTDSGWAVWSPDGTQLAFDSPRADRKPYDSRVINDVFVMNPDGSGVKKLTDSKAASENAAWSPNGSLIAFDRGKHINGTAIYVMRPSGRKLRKITNPRRPLADYGPRFSPDGTHLVFTRKHGNADHAPAAIFTVQLDGRGLHRLTPFSMRVGQADWSPDGKQIVFDASPNPKGNGDVYVMSAAGGQAVNLTKNPLTTAGSDGAVWSPDSSKILFVDNRFVNGVGTTGLATMNPDGSDRQFIVSRTLDAGEPDWQSIAPAAQLHTLSQESRTAKNGPLTLFTIDSFGNAIASIETVAGSKTTTLWHCPTKVFCGQPVSFAWAPDGRRVAFTLDEIGGNSPYVGLHVVNVVTGQDTHIPGGAPQDPITDANRAAWDAYFKKMAQRIGCWPGANLAWSPDGSSLVYNCGPSIHVLNLHGSGNATVPTGSDAFWPTWSPDGTQIAFSTRLKPSKGSQVYSVRLDGSHRRLLATGGAAPAWSPDGRTIAYQTRCGIRLVTPSGRNVTPHARNATRAACGVIGYSGPPAWSPDGKELAMEPVNPAYVGGTFVMNRNGRGFHQVSAQATTTWYGSLPGRPGWRPIASSRRPR